MLNDEDLSATAGVGAIIRDDQNMILVFWHQKLKFWTIPVGKVGPDQTATQALIAEVREETGMQVVAYRELAVCPKSYDLKQYGHDRVVHKDLHLFDTTCSGEATNAEPHKHPQMVWLTPEELAKKEPISDLTEMALQHLTTEA